MKPSQLPGCVWRGNEGDGSSFHCFQPSIQKSVCPADCAACSLRSEAHLPCEISAAEPVSQMMQVEAYADKPSLFGKMAHGIAGLTKAAIGMDYPGDEVVKKRWDICKSCEFFRLWQCQKCGCIASMKIRVSGESCPIGRWNAES